MENDQKHIKIDLSKLELQLMNDGYMIDSWPICAGKKESSTPKGHYLTSLKITQDKPVHLIYRRYLRRFLSKMPFYKKIIDLIKNRNSLYSNIAGKSTYIEGGVITLKDKDGKYVPTSIHGWYDFERGYLSRGCIRVPNKGIKTLLDEVREETPVVIY
ncbi:MAG: L,D-transpeptidase [archaeon]